MEGRGGEGGEGRGGEKRKKKRKKREKQFPFHSDSGNSRSHTVLASVNEEDEDPASCSPALPFGGMALGGGSSSIPCIFLSQFCLPLVHRAPGRAQGSLGGNCSPRNRRGCEAMSSNRLMKRPRGL